MLAVLKARADAEVSRYRTLVEIALVESRVAAFSTLLLFGIVLCAVVLLLFVWILLMALATLGLASLGLGLAASLGMLLAVHAVGLVSLGLFGHGLLKNLRFSHTLSALGHEDSGDAAPPASPIGGSRAGARASGDQTTPPM